MALINCPECGKQVSNQAIACPNCGYPIQTTVKPIGAILSVERYQELLEIEENNYLLNLAVTRMKNNPSVISEDKFYARNGIDDDFLSDLPEIELE